MRPLLSTASHDERDDLQVVEDDLPDLFEMVESSTPAPVPAEPTTGQWQPYDSVQNEDVFAEQLSELIVHSLIDEF